MRITRHAIRTYDLSGRDGIYSWTDDTLILTAAIAAFDELFARCCCGSILQSWPGRILGLAGMVFRYIVSFTMYFRSKFLEISKPIHFWNCEVTDKAVILDFQNGRHKIRILRYLGF